MYELTTTAPKGDPLGRADLTLVPPRVELSCPDLQRRRVLRLVDAKFPAARQRQARDRSPSLLVDRRAPHVLLLHFGDQRLDVVAHQEEFVYVVLVGRMHCYLGWREREDQPAM